LKKLKLGPPRDENLAAVFFRGNFDRVLKLLEVAYVGRLSRRLLTPDDLAMPLDIHDKASGLDYFQAVTALAKLYPGPVQTGVFKNATPGAVSVFSNGVNAINSFTNPFPGQSGGRNQIRGDGYFGVDLGLSKRWLMPWSDKHSLQFRAEVFNVTNSVRFNVQTGSLALDTSSTFGNYTGTLTNARVMQFALRYEF
jgi:hypothetical protein